MRRQTRIRSWAIGRGHTFVGPSVYDASCERYFAAIAPPDASADPALVAWTEDDGVTRLDAAVGGGSTRLPDGVAALVPVGSSKRSDGGGGGGVLAVTPSGAVHWFGPDARERASHSAPQKEGKGKAKRATEAARRRIVETARGVSGGVLVVTSDAARAGGDAARSASLYRAAGNEHGGFVVEVAWEVAIEPPPGATGATRVVAAAASENDFVVLWSGGVWAAYAPRGSTPGVPTRWLALSPKDAASPAEDAKENAQVSAKKTPGKKRSSRSVGAANDDTDGALPAAACAALGDGYYAVASTGIGGGGGGARVTVIDATYGAVHAAIDARPAVSSGGGASGVQISVVSDDDGGNPGGVGHSRRHLVMALADEVVVVEVPALAPLSLAAALGRLSAPTVDDVDDATGAAASKALGVAGVAACATPPKLGVIEPKLPGGPSDSAGVVDLGDVSGADWWSGGATGDRVEKAAAAAVALFGGDAPVKAAAAARALEPFASGAVALPPAVLAAALEGCARRNEWEPISRLISEGLVPGSAAAPGLVAALVAADRLVDLDAFLGSARDVSASDVRRCLRTFLGEGDVSARSRAAMEAVAGRVRAEAETAVNEAEAAAGKETNKKTEKEKGGDEGRSSAAARARRALHRAHVAAAAAEDFDAPWAAMMHALCARPIDPATAAEVLPDLSAGAAAKLVVYLARWLAVYANAACVDISAGSPSGLPSVGAVVSWAAAVIDAHFTTFAMGGAGDGRTGEDAAAMASLRASATKLQAACASVGNVVGALDHVREGAPLPEQQGVVSSNYSIEVVDW